MNNPCRILIIEDYQADFLLMARHLKRSVLSAECECVADMAGLSDAVRSGRWDVILSDFTIPGQSFTGMLEIIRSDLPDTPVILVSGTVGEEKAVDLLKEGVWDFVLKDNMARLVPVIERNLQEAENRRTRRLAEDRIRQEAEERMHFALTAAAVGVWEWDVRTDELFWSKEVYEICGIERRALTVKDFMAIVHPDDLGPMMSRARESIIDRESFRREFRIIRSNGEIVWVSSLARAEYDDGGTPLKLVGTVQDITKRKELEIDALSRERQLDSFFNGTTAGFVLLDRDLRFVRINDTLAGMNGIPAAEHIGRTVREVLPELAPVVEPIIEQVLSTRIPVQNVEISGITPKVPGVKRHWAESFFPVIGGDGELFGAGVIVVEITPLKQAQEKLEAYSRELEETNGALKVLLRQRDSDRKEIEEKTLANVEQLVLPYIDLLRKDAGCNPDTLAYVNIIENNLREITSSFSGHPGISMKGLSHMEILITNLIRQGKRDKEIADSLQLSIHTVKAHRRNIRKKLGLVGRNVNLRTFISPVS